MTTSQASVLIVGGETALADSYAEWLDAEYDVRTAYSGADAVAALDHPVDVILLDRCLPDLSGEAVLDAVEERGVDCRVALVSAVEPDFDVLALGYDLRVEKPVTDPETLRSAVETLRRRDAYDDEMRRYFSLASKRGTLEATKSRSELADSETYAELVDELDRLSERVASTMAGLDNDDYRADFRDGREAWLAPSDDDAGETETGAGAETRTPSAESPGRRAGPETERE